MWQLELTSIISCYRGRRTRACVECCASCIDGSGHSWWCEVCDVTAGESVYVQLLYLDKSIYGENEAALNATILRTNAWKWGLVHVHRRTQWQTCGRVGGRQYCWREFLMASFWVPVHFPLKQAERMWGNVKVETLLKLLLFAQPCNHTCIHWKEGEMPTHVCMHALINYMHTNTWTHACTHTHKHTQHTHRYTI